MMKKRILVLIISAILSISVLGCSTEEKFVGSKDTAGFNYLMEVYKSVEEIKLESDLIVIASYSSKPTERCNKDETLGTESYWSTYSMNIEKVYKGDVSEGSVITFGQNGKPDSDEYETKIKKDQRYLLFLFQKDTELTNGEIIYDAAGAEQGIVEIKENNKLYSYYDIGIMPEYDGSDFVKLEDQIIK